MRRNSLAVVKKGSRCPRMAGVSSVQDIWDGDSVNLLLLFEVDTIKLNTRSDTPEKTSLIP